MKKLPQIPPIVVAIVLEDIKSQLDKAEPNTKESTALAIIALALCELGMRLSDEQKFIEHLIAKKEQVS